MKSMHDFDQLIEIMRRLRRDCPWDREQTLKSLRRFTLEEAYEVVDAIDRIETEGVNDLIEELGDLLLQVVFQATLIDEIRSSSDAIKNVVQNLNEKLIRRHPHVFGDSELANASQVIAKWEEIKAQENSKKKKGMENIEASLTALQKAHKIGRYSAKSFFDWPDASSVWEKVKEEQKELEEAHSLEEQEEEWGDLVFSLVQWARHRGFDPEVALSSANAKFKNRFSKLEMELTAKGLKLSELTEDEKEKYWKAIKSQKNESSS